MKLLLIAILVLYGSVATWSQTIPTVSLSKVTPEGGVTYTSIICIGEDETGFIWFGSNDGLFQYNSKEIRRYCHLLNDEKSVPSNRINEIYRDKNDKLWIATENGLCSYNPKGDNFTTYYIESTSGNSIGKNIHSFFEDDKGLFWFADELGFGTVDPEDGKADYNNIAGVEGVVNKVHKDGNGTIWVFYNNGKIYYKKKGYTTFSFLTQARSASIRSVLIDDQNIWIAYLHEGLHCLGLDGSEKHYYSDKLDGAFKLPSNQVRSIVKNENQIWAGTYGGLVIIEDYKIVSVEHPDKHSELPNHSIWSLFKDSNENIWIGTYLGGLCFHSKYNNSFFHYTQSGPKNSISYNVVSSFVQIPKEKTIIVASEDGILNYFNPETNRFTNVEVVYEGVRVRSVKSLAYDKFGCLWVGTYGHGVLYREKNNTQFKQLELPFSTGFQALTLLCTNEGLWVSNYPLGVYFYDFETKQISNHRHNSVGFTTISDDNVRQILKDRNGNMWFATRKGLNVLKKGTSSFTRYFHTKKDTNSIASDFIYAIHEDDNGFLWLGTNGQGLDKFNPETETAEHFTMEDGLPGNEVFSILQDENKKFWITTNQGLCMFDPVSEEIRSFYNSNGIGNNRFNPLAGIISREGEIYFGGTNGFIRFKPEEIKLNPIEPSAIIVDLFINNAKVTPESEEGILEDVISKTSLLKLHYKQNSIGFKFVTSNYVEPYKNRIKYRMLGFNDEWIEVDHTGIANCTKVPPGNYTFEVMAANNDGEWSKDPTQIAIRIVPPLWFRWYAYIIYGLLVVLSILYSRKQFINRHKLKNEIEIERIKRENEDYLHRMKLQFFTNVSHEFRTPLTLIQGPVNNLVSNDKGTEDSKRQLQLVKNNTERLLRLVNQFLDFRKIDSGNIKLNPVHTDIVSFCDNVIGCFEEHANSRGFTFEFKSDASKLNMDFDPDKLDKILFNLLSNAFKNTPNGGRIYVNLNNNNGAELVPDSNTFQFGDEIREDYVEISISDSGKGIPEKDIEDIFNRFYKSDESQQGTGIGLSLSKNYVLLHKGNIKVESELHKGTRFVIRIPQYQGGTFKEQLELENNSNLSDYSAEPFSDVMSDLSSEKAVKNSEALILIAEDNLELLNYLSEMLQEHFRVAKAVNGKQALEEIHSLFPDLVVSDIMMPEMDGIELCNSIKQDIRTSHIPVVLLTALNSVQDRISGLQSGADAYIPKPFNDKLLITQIDNLIESRKVLHSAFHSSETEWADEYKPLDLDQKLLLKGVRYVEENLSNINLTVEHLAEHLNLSRTHLHRKLKALTNQSATEFIRYIRLKEAVKLLQEGNHKVNEVGYLVGFNSHTYFTKSFKKQFGKSPSEFVKTNQKQASLV